MKYRLILGPVLIAGLLLLAWADQSLDRIAVSSLLGQSAAAWLARVENGDAAGVTKTFPPGVIVFLASVVLSALAARELSAIMRDKGILASRRITTTAAIAGLLVSCVVPTGVPATVAVAVVGSAGAGVLLAALAFYSRHRTVEGVVAGAGGALLAFVYLGLMFGFVLAIRRDHSIWLLLWVIIVAKSCDIGAYFTGKAIGRRKLILWLSPGKTWEGLFGGVVASSLVGLGGLALLGWLGTDPLPPIWTGLVSGALFGLIGQTGDLVASLFKRDAGIKDASSILPGFGGILDVLDSPLLVAPVAFWWIKLVHAGLGNT